MNDTLQYGVWKLNALFQENKDKRAELRQSDKDKMIQWAKEETIAVAESGLGFCILKSEFLKSYLSDVATALFDSGMGVRKEFNEEQKLVGLRVIWSL